MLRMIKILNLWNEIEKVATRRILAEFFREDVRLEFQ